MNHDSLRKRLMDALEDTPLRMGTDELESVEIIQAAVEKFIRDYAARLHPTLLAITGAHPDSELSESIRAGMANVMLAVSQGEYIAPDDDDTER